MPVIGEGTLRMFCNHSSPILVTVTETQADKRTASWPIFSYSSSFAQLVI